MDRSTFLHGKIFSSLSSKYRFFESFDQWLTPCFSVVCINITPLKSEKHSQTLRRSCLTFQIQICLFNWFVQHLTFNLVDYNFAGIALVSKVINRLHTRNFSLNRVFGRMNTKIMQSECYSELSLTRIGSGNQILMSITVFGFSSSQESLTNKIVVCLHWFLCGLTLWTVTVWL